MAPGARVRRGGYAVDLTNWNAIGTIILMCLISGFLAWWDYKKDKP